MNEEEEKLNRTRLRVRKMRNFYSNVITYVLVNILLLIINLISNPHHLWFFWVALIWGLVLLVQAFNIFTIRNRFLGDEWEERKIRELSEKEKNKTNNKFS